MQAFSYEENKIKLHDVGHMTKMAPMPIYIMNLSKYSPEPLDRFAGNFVCSIYIKQIIVCMNNANGLTLTYLTLRSNFRVKRRNHLVFFDKILHVNFKVRGNENVGYMTRLLPRPYVLKILINLVPWNQRFDFHELRYIAHGTMAHNIFDHIMTL